MHALSEQLARQRHQDRLVEADRQRRRVALVRLRRASRRAEHTRAAARASQQAAEQAARQLRLLAERADLLA